MLSQYCNIILGNESPGHVPHFTSNWINSMDNLWSVIITLINTFFDVCFKFVCFSPLLLLFNLDRFCSSSFSSCLYIPGLYCSPMMPRVGYTNSQVLPWLELTARSLLSTAPSAQIRCSNGAGSNGNKFLGSMGNWTGDLLQKR